MEETDISESARKHVNIVIECDEQRTHTSPCVQAFETLRISHSAESLPSRDAITLYHDIVTAQIWHSYLDAAVNPDQANARELWVEGAGPECTGVLVRDGCFIARNGAARSVCALSIQHL